MRGHGLRRTPHFADRPAERVQAVENRNTCACVRRPAGVHRMSRMPTGALVRGVSHDLSPGKALARREGFEPPLTVLETAVLPLNYRRMKNIDDEKREATFGGGDGHRTRLNSGVTGRRPRRAVPTPDKQLDPRRASNSRLRAQHAEPLSSTSPSCTGCQLALERQVRLWLYQLSYWGKTWSRWQESNLRPAASETAALVH